MWGVSWEGRRGAGVWGEGGEKGGGGGSWGGLDEKEGWGGGVLVQAEVRHALHPRGGQAAGQGRPRGVEAGRGQGGVVSRAAGAGPHSLVLQVGGEGVQRAPKAGVGRVVVGVAVPTHQALVVAVEGGAWGVIRGEEASRLGRRRVGMSVQTAVVVVVVMMLVVMMVATVRQAFAVQ